MNNSGIPLLYDITTGQLMTIPFTKYKDRIQLHLEFKGDEAKFIIIVKEVDSILRAMPSKIESVHPIHKWQLTLERYTPDGALFKDAKFIPEYHYTLTDQLSWWDDIDSNLKKFVGKGIYQTQIKIQKKENVSYYLQLEQVSDTFEIIVNNHSYIGFSQHQPSIDITDSVKETNDIMVIVHSNLANALLEKPQNHYGISGEIALIEKR